MTQPTSRPRHLVLAAGFATALLLVGCSGPDRTDSRGGGLPTAEPTSTDATPSTAPTPTPSATPSATAKPQPTRPVKLPGADGDVDGDGKADQISVAPVPAAAGVWTVTLRLSALGARRGQVHADTEQPRVAGVVDADSDGFGEVFLTVDQGASTAFWGVLRVVGGVVREVTSDGQPLHLAVGGSVTHGDGFVCREDVKTSRGRELVVYSGDSFDGTTWEGTITSYAWEGGSVRVVRQRNESFPTDGSGGDPRLRPYYEADCGNLSAQGG